MRPIRRVAQQTVPHPIELRMVHVGSKALIIADRALPIPPLPRPRSPRLIVMGDRGSLAGKDFAHAILIARQ